MQSSHLGALEKPCTSATKQLPVSASLSGLRSGFRKLSTVVHSLAADRRDNRHGSSPCASAYRISGAVRPSLITVNCGFLGQAPRRQRALDSRSTHRWNQCGGKHGAHPATLLSPLYPRLPIPPPRPPSDFLRRAPSPAATQISFSRLSSSHETASLRPRRPPDCGQVQEQGRHTRTSRTLGALRVT
ncbi:hypothetical protein BV20DRAFT_447563 [Pilatotrama ljubarskyi]|nr:hypothetical protein BV20DRAFT_447563 [Pilatotrama ljubarskyi]